ncbi:unnamed protein product [Brassica napus]|uniref:(rape) hypothetical protein n=1 Tax=Brassica napus TaxID=3708 RepID=A0A816XP74_BRANA|nr:unnamed protein product [Brassica napus]
MSQSSSLKSDAASAFTILPEFAAAKAATMELNQSFKTKLVSFRSFIRKTTTSKDEVRASIRCIGRCIDNMEISLNDYEVIVEDKVDRPEVSSSEDLSHDQLRSNATLLLKYFKNRTLEYFFAAFFPPDITHVDDAMAQFGLIRSHLENCESLIYKQTDASSLPCYDCLNTSEEEGMKMKMRITKRKRKMSKHEEERVNIRSCLLC